MVLYCIIQKLDYWPGLRSSAPPNWDFTIQYSLENWKVVKTMGDGRTSYTDEVSQRFLNLAMKNMTPNSGQTNGVKNMHLWHFWGFFGFRFFFSRWKKPLSFRISIRQRRQEWNSAYLFFQDAGRSRWKFARNTFGSLASNWDFWKILIAINPYKIETMPVLFIKLLCLLQKLPQTEPSPSPIVLK